MASKYSSKGCQLQLSISAVYTNIAQLIEIKPPSPKVGVEEVPDLSSGVPIPKQTTGYVNSGTSGGTVYFDPADTTQKAITAYLTAPAQSSWKVIYPDGGSTTWSFTGIVTDFTPTVRVLEFMKADFGIEVNSAVTGW